MTSLSQQFYKQLLKQKSVLWSLLIALLLLSYFSRSLYQNFLYLQAQNMSQLSLFNEIIKPLAGLALILIVYLNLIIASQFHPNYFARGQQAILLNSSLSSAHLTKQMLMTMLKINLIPILFFVLITLTYRMNSPVDSCLLVATSIALLLGSLLFAMLLLAMSFVVEKRLLMLVAGSFLVIAVFMLDAYLVKNPQLMVLSFYQRLFLNFREGLISIFDLSSVALWLIFLFAMNRGLLNRLRGLKKGNISWAMALSLGIILLLGIIQSQFERQDLEFGYFDISQKKNNSLSAQNLKKLSHLTASIKITAVVDKEQNRDEIRNAFKLIHQYQKNSELLFTSRQALSQQQKSNSKNQLDQFVSIDIDGVVLSHRFPFDQSAKQTLLSMIARIEDRSQKWVTFIEGHGEVSPLQKGNRDLSHFYQQLKAEHWSVAVQNLSNQPIIADNTQLVVLAAGQKKWLSSEIKILLDYLKQGGNLLLLREEKDNLPAAIEQFIGIEKLPGTLIDWRGYQSGTPHPAVLIVNQFTKHAVNFSINSLLAFPWSVGLNLVDNDIHSADRIYEVILQTHEGVWNELDSNQSELSFTPEKGEQTKSFAVAISLELAKQKQRIIVIGDASFLSNGAINNYANRQFAMNLIHWLSDSPVELLQQQSKDHFILLSPWVDFIFKWGFLLVSPLILYLLFLVAKKKAAVTPINKGEAG